MIDEITLMKYADGTLTSEEKKEVKKEIQNNPEYLKIISNFKKSRDILLDVSEDIKSEELPNSIKEIHKKIERKRKLALYNIFRKGNFYFGLSNIFSSTMAIVLPITAALTVFLLILVKLIQKGFFFKLFDLWPFVLKSWYGILEFISVLSKRIEAFVF